MAREIKSVYLPTYTHNKLKEFAKRNGHTISWVLVEAVLHYINYREGEHEK